MGFSSPTQLFVFVEMELKHQKKRPDVERRIACVLCNAINGVQRRNACNASLPGWQIRAAEGLVHKMSANISYNGIQINFTPGISMLIEQIG